MKKILIAACDPGGANAIFPLIKSLSKKFVLGIVLSKSAKQIFSNQGINYIDGDRLKERQINAILKKDWDIFLAGTSLGNTIDKKIFLKLDHQTKSVYVLDYWTYYRERFADQNQNLKYIPDYILVMDRNAKREMIQKGFDLEAIMVTGNPFFEYFVNRIHKESENKNKVLFISQPIAQMPNYKNGMDRGYSETDVLRDIIEIIEECKFNCNLHIRLHPKERENKYTKYLKNSKISLDFQPLEKSLSSFGLVIGMTSIVLFFSTILGKNVISYQPGLKKKYQHDTNSKLVGNLIINKNLLRLYLLNYFKYTHRKIKASHGVGQYFKKNAVNNITQFLEKL